MAASVEEKIARKEEEVERLLNEIRLLKKTSTVPQKTAEKKVNSVTFCSSHFPVLSFFRQVFFSF